MKKLDIQKLTWIDICNPTKKDIDSLRGRFTFHPIILRELLSPTLRSKVEHYDNYLFMILHFPIYRSKEKTTKSVELDFLITKNSIITIRYGEIGPLKEFWEKCNSDKNYLYFQDSPALLLHCILERLNNFSLRQIDHITRKINNLEKHIFIPKSSKEETKMAESILLVRRDILDFYRTVKPQKSILKSLKIRGLELFDKKMEPYFEDIIGDYLRIWDLLENHKESIRSLQEANDSWLNTRTNMIMRVVTLFAVIVFPLTLIASLFGMNTQYLPVVGTKYDFWIILAIMIAGTFLMIFIFRKKKWL